VAKRDDSLPGGEIESIIGGGTTFNGDLTFSGQVRLDGTIDGSVKSNGDESSQLVIGAKGRVKGDVDVAHVIVGGVVEGSVGARKSLKILSDGKVSGTATYGTLEVVSGGQVDGELRAGSSPAVRATPGIVQKAS